MAIVFSSLRLPSSDGLTTKEFDRQFELCVTRLYTVCYICLYIDCTLVAFYQTIFALNEHLSSAAFCKCYLAIFS